ncbi:MAG: hypothetical protein V3T09_04345, partial [bacterium]
ILIIYYAKFVPVYAKSKGQRAESLFITGYKAFHKFVKVNFSVFINNYFIHYCFTFETSYILIIIT